MPWLVLHVLCQSRVQLNHERSEVPRLLLHESRVHLNHERSEVPRLVLHVLCQIRVLEGTFFETTSVAKCPG